ncbi:MAG TPA: folate-binding protein [Paracoccaceae bacterium]|nr:folate-binding protein [Paracoccaceae bacterium]
MTENRLHSRALIRISATVDDESPRAFLQGLVTSDTAGPLPCYAALLSAQGKHLFDFIVWADDNSPGGDLLLDCEAELADELVKRLSMYRLRKKLAIARDDALGVFWSLDGPEVSSPDPRLAALGHRWIAQASPNDSGADTAWHAHRLSLGVPEGRAELGDVLWLETNAVELNGVSFTKGCYVGQENTARMNWRQKVNRRLVVVPMESSQPDRQRVAYPQFGLAVDHLRVADIPAEFVPGWMRLSADDSSGDATA